MFPSRGLWLRPVGKPSECFRMTAGVRTGKAQNEHMFTGLPPKADLPPDLRTTIKSHRLPESAAKFDFGRGAPPTFG